MISKQWQEDTDEDQERAFLCEQSALKEFKDATVALWVTLLPFVALLGFLSRYTGILLIQLYPFMGVSNFVFAFGLHALLAWLVEQNMQHLWKCSYRGVAVFSVFIIGLLGYLGYLAYERATLFVADGDDPDGAWRKALGWFAAETIIPIAGGVVVALLTIRRSGDKENWKATKRNREVCEVSAGKEDKVFDRSIGEAAKIKRDLERNAPNAKKEINRLGRLIALFRFYHPKQDNDENTDKEPFPLSYPSDSPRR